MKLSPELLNSAFFDESEFNAIFNAHGLYNTEQFVLRLSPKNHSLIDGIVNGDFDQSNIDSDTVQAYSTYLHETIHWWQHVGSTTGLVMSLCYPLQTHSNIEHIKEWSSLGYSRKSIKEAAREGELSGKTHLDKGQALANTIVNNTMDFEFFKKWILKPDLALDIYNDPYFESQGHCFHVVYSNFVSTVSELFDPDSKVMHYNSGWEKEFNQLTADKVMGYYYGSPLFRRRVGVVDIFEGQACFSQMQFLANINGASFDVEEFKSAGMLHGVYEKAFNEFVDLTGIKRPVSVLDPSIALFLLICDLSINPVEGFPCEINDFCNFVNHADPGIRFELLCRSVNDLKLNVDELIIHYSKEEYINVSSILLSKAGLEQTSNGWNTINLWLDSCPELVNLLNERKSFSFSPENIPIRLMLSSFILFSLDKMSRPEFFCWPGYWKTHRSKGDGIESMWLNNLSLFSDKEDDDGIFIRQFPGIDSEKLKATLNNFFGSNLIYNLSRQWVLREGEFSLDFSWLSEKITEQEWRDWAEAFFEKQYGMGLSSIEIN